MRSGKVGEKKEDRAESCCFFCKDGGFLRVCDFRNCLKVYHPACVKRNDDLLSENNRWYCGWHYCANCGKYAKFHCFTCPDSFCGRCLRNSKFVILRGKKGLCHRCIELAMLIEECKEPDSNGCRVDFNDQDTYEFMFKDYWETLKETERLSKEDLVSQNGLMRKSHNYASGFNSEEDYEEDENEDVTIIDAEEQSESSQKRKIHGKQPCSSTEKQRKRSKMEFIGWGSILLIEFFESIGQETVEELSEQDAAAIITRYCQENKLFHPEKENRIVCDSKLYKLFGKETVNTNNILKLLSCHFTENSEQLAQTKDDLPMVCEGAVKLRQEKEVLGSKEVAAIDGAEKLQAESHQLCGDANLDSRLTGKLDWKDGTVPAVYANQDGNNTDGAGNLDEKDENVLDVNEDCKNSSFTGKLYKKIENDSAIVAGEEFSFAVKLDREDEDVSPLNANQDCENSIFAEKLDKKDENASVTIANDENLEETLWYCITPNGVTKGPYSMSLLREWYETSPYRLKFRVFRAGEGPENAVLLARTSS